jgi:serine/threonine-protein kinase PRP4
LLQLSFSYPFIFSILQLCAAHRFGELLDGRYEITAVHGKGVFSTVVRAKDLKAGKDDPEEVAIKIIRNNETM